MQYLPKTLEEDLIIQNDKQQQNKNRSYVIQRKE